MKINKLLFFLLAVFSLNSCVEYVDNGTKPDGPEKPEEQNFKAEHSNPEEAKYAGDIFKFKAMLNNVDVTATTKFKVNGTNISGNSYTAVKLGSNSVIATMDNFTANFKFDVLEKEDEPEPEPTGNRIEYEGDAFPVTDVMWLVHVENNEIQLYDRGGVACTVWAMLAYKLDANDEVINQFLTIAYVPIKSDGKLAFPNNSPGPIEHIEGFITIDGNDVFDTTNVSYVFAGTGNTSPADGAPNPWSGTANFTGLGTGAAAGNSAELFWNGAWDANGRNLMAKAKMGNLINGFNGVKIKNFKKLNNTQLSKFVR